ncbi:MULTISPECIES: hypothetical protein [Deinococcus]|jgi:hypothetical protein|uniref:Uncharacterized protein n=1 Tax=Deinococcus soli (ex Cha et al. 2016) TaxID=1309411 RepID=A0A0F7JQH1_9DEIO|nr:MULTISPECIES: hypothetical protein [Deinococcus]AKH17033.1 hypothetical protein SY84_08140 [Deinococcus soli (ex Cha et al. 2016)]MDK2014505.1 hypothetical protein [Deinococcus sp. 43]GGB80244.1 hypothetical protein GCM10008019_40610 [Deinococcus soli (ex Cha et al. 2016)]
MAYKKLSEQVMELSNPQRSDTFVKLFQEAVRSGKIDGAYLPERFTMPKQFTRRGSTDTYQRDTREMIFDHTPDFDAWFEETNRDLAAARRGGNIKPSMEAVESGLVDFQTMVEETRRKMQASFEKGQALGKGRAKTTSGKKKK